MISLRILIVGYFHRSSLFRTYYNTESKLSNGFIRAGHHVICFSDRDHAREATVFGSQKFGASKMSAKLVETAEHYQPHLVLFGHSDLIESDTYDRIREEVKGVRLATFCVDAVFREQAMTSFRKRAAKCDAAFITTADERALASLDIPREKLHFMPNPVDNSIETARVFEIPRTEMSFDGQFLGTGIGKREEQLSFIQEHLPKEYRFTHGGRAFGSERLTSTEFFSRLTDAPVSLNLPLDDTRADLMPHLYSSDRIAQLLGQGITTLSPAQSKLSDLYEDGLVEYKDRDDLLGKMIELRENDELRQNIGRTAHRIAHEKTSVTGVAEMLLRVSCPE